MAGLRDRDTSPPRSPFLPRPALPTLRASSRLASAAATLRCPWSRRGGRCRSQPCGGSSTAAPARPGLQQRLSRSRQASQARKRRTAGESFWRGVGIGRGRKPGAALAHSRRATDVCGIEGQQGGVGHREARELGASGRGCGWGWESGHSARVISALGTAELG